MQPFTTHTGVVAAMDRADVDTDQIIPKQFLKRIERTGFGEFLFFDWRFFDDGADNPDFELNHPKNAGASILLARRNFGCGSSREHAVWALENYGIRAVIAPSYADIFFNNCFKNGVLPVTLDDAIIDDLFARTAGDAPYELTVDLQSQTVSSADGLNVAFEIDPTRKNNLLNGLDDIALTLKQEALITKYEQEQSITSF